MIMLQIGRQGFGNDCNATLLKQNCSQFQLPAGICGGHNASYVAYSDSFEVRREIASTVTLSHCQ